MPLDQPQSALVDVQPGPPDLSPLTLVKQQRNSVSAAYHDLQIEHTILKGMLVSMQEKLIAAEKRIEELSQDAGGRPDGGEA